MKASSAWFGRAGDAGEAEAVDRDRFVGGADRLDAEDVFGVVEAREEGLAEVVHAVDEVAEAGLAAGRPWRRRASAIRCRRT